MRNRGALSVGTAGAVLFMGAVGYAQQTLPSVSEERARQANEEIQRGLRLFAEGKFWGASQAFEKAYALFPNHPDVAFNYGLALQTLGQFERALAPLRTTLQVRPDDLEARLSLGVCLLGLGKLEEGAKELELVLEKDPAHATAAFYRAVSLFRLRRGQEADEVLRRMAERHPRSASTYFYIARAYRMTWNYNDGEKMIDHAIALDSGQANFHLERGLIEIELKNPKEAEKSLLEALRLHPEIPGGHTALGRLYLELFRDPDRALPFLETALRFNPTDSRAWLYQGNAYLRLGELPEAVSSLRRAVELDPAFERAHFLLATALQRLGKKEEAAHHFAEAARVGPQARMERARRVRMLDPPPGNDAVEPDGLPTRR